MFLGEQLVDAVKFPAHQLNQPGHIEALKMQMEEENEDILDLSEEQPQFFIETVPSSMNSEKFQRLNGANYPF